MMGNNQKKVYRPVNIGLFVFIIALLLFWIFDKLGFEHMAQICGGIGLLGFLYSMVNLQTLINNHINGNSKNDDKE